MATREFDVKRSAVELLNDWLAPWRARWNERKRARVDVSDEKRLAREQSKRLKLSERLEARLRSNLRSELRKNERLVIDCLTRLGFNNIVVKEKKRTVSKFKFAQTSASPTAFYLRVDTVKRPWGRQNNVLELQKDYVTATLASAVEKPVHVHNTPDEGFWYVIERAPKPEMQEYIDCLLMMPESTGPTDIPLGIDVNHRLRHAELCKMPHLLVAGTTGYGKSVFLHNLICTLIQRARPDQVQITLVDLAGGVELGVYRNVPHLWGKVVEVETVGGDDLDLFTGDDVEDVIEIEGESRRRGFRVESRIYSEPEQVAPILARVRLEVQRRMALFVEHDVRNIEHWNIKHRYQRYQRLPYWVIVIDELQNVMLDRALRDDVESLLAKIAAVARKTGIILVVATQRPSTDVVTGLIKANFPARVAFNMASSHDSMTVLGNGDAASLGKPGRLIYQHATTYVTAQSPFLSPALVGDIIERVVEGRPPITELTHSVGKLDMVEWAIEKNEGVFNIDDVYFAFKPRGVTHRDVRECLLAFVGQVVEVKGTFYRMKRVVEGNVFEEVADK